LILDEVLVKLMIYTHRCNKERSNKEQNGARKGAKLWKIASKLGLLGVLSLMNIPLESPSLDHKEQNCLVPTKFYSSIAPTFVQGPDIV